MSKAPQDPSATTDGDFGLVPLDETDEATGLALRDDLSEVRPSEGTDDEFSLRAVRPTVWCRGCNAYHEEGRCPGDVEASGPERHGWRVMVQAPDGRREVYGLLIAPAGGRWRARVLTYPRVLWTFPGGRATIKFIADHPHEAERSAKKFVQEHCRQRGYKMLEDEPLVSVSDFDAEEHALAAKCDSNSRRKLRSVPIRFGKNDLSEEAHTADLSEGGLFIATAEGVPLNAPVRMLLELAACKLPLRGVVRWRRKRSAPGRSQGLGVQIIRPPAIYVHYVRQLP